MQAVDLDTSKIREWRSIVTLIVFVVANVLVLFPRHIYIPFPRSWRDALLNGLSLCRVIEPRRKATEDNRQHSESERDRARPERFAWFRKHFVLLDLPLNMITAPLIADLFLLAILAIGRKEVHDGTIGADNIFPIDIMVFFLTLAYIAISIDASGLIRYLAFKVLQKGGSRGHWLFLYLYAFFFLLTTCIGNDPVILSGTAFLSYMTRISSNIKAPRAWIFSQFAVANIGSAVLVSSNPTNLVLAGAFQIKFINYTANIIVPVFVTAILLFPFLLWIVFPYESLIPSSITLHELPQAAREKVPVNPNIPNARGTADDEEDGNSEEARLLSLEEIMNPFLDKKGAYAGAIIMAVTLVTILALNAATDTAEEHPVFYVTLPAAFLMLCWDLAFGWTKRKETREIARRGRKAVEEARARRIAEAEEKGRRSSLGQHDQEMAASDELPPRHHQSTKLEDDITPSSDMSGTPSAKAASSHEQGQSLSAESAPGKEVAATEQAVHQRGPQHQQATLVSAVRDGYRWCQETFPTTTAVLAHLPLPLVPFALCMFVLVQGLSSKGWVPVFAHGWDHWVQKTGTVGAIGGMAFLAVVLCNFAGTNIGTTILLCRVIQAWVAIHENSGVPLTERNFWATVYSMAIGVNYGAFSTAFSASLAGLLWRDILAKKHITVKGSEFARVNFRIIAFAMIVGCAVLVAEVYIMRKPTPYTPG